VSEIIDKFPHRVEEWEHIWIPMPDGVRLSARVWLPETAPSAPVPAILEYIPYRKRDGTRVRDDCRHRYWAGHGYAAIRLDIRGTGDSEGLITDEYALVEQDDCITAIAWIANQNWCSGRVGMTGISWGGFNALQVAARRPPELKAIITHCSTDDRYADDVHWMGGCLLTDGFFWGSGFFHSMSLPPDPEIAEANWREAWLERLEQWQPPAPKIWMQHQRRDEYWQHGSVCENYADIECAVYAVGGWEDGYSNAVPRMLAHLSCPVKGLVGPWGHKYPEQGIPGPAIGFLQHSLRWWDHWLKDVNTGIMDEPTYTMFLQEHVTPDACLDAVPGNWITEPSWPSPRIKTRQLFLNASGLSFEAEDEIPMLHESPQTLGATGGSWCPYGLGGVSPDLAVDQREDDGRSLVFDSSPLTDALVVVGAPEVHLRLAVDKPNAFVVVRLTDVSPDGVSRRVSYGMLNLSRRSGFDATVPMVPREPTDVVIRLNDLAHRFAAGHKLRLAVSTTYWPMVWPSGERVTLTLTAGASRLALPVRPLGLDDEVGPAFDPVEMAPPAKTTAMTSPDASRTIDRDLKTGRWTEKLVEDHGRYHIHDIDLDVAHSVHCTFDIIENDPLSADARWVWRSKLDRDGWHIDIEATTRLRADALDFIVDTDIDAKEDGISIFSKAWRDRIPRDGL
jgi:hypothetical protein